MKRSTVIGLGILLLISSLVLTGCACCSWFRPTPTSTPTPTPTPPVYKAQSPDGEVVISGTAAGIEDIKSVDPIPASETKQLVQKYCPDKPLSDALKGVEIDPSGLTLSPAATILFDIGTGHGYKAYDSLTILTIPGCEKGDAQVKADIRWAEGKIAHTSIFALVKLRNGKETVVVPNVVRKHVDEAMEIIVAANLQVGQIKDQVSDQQPGTVIWQNPEPSVEVAPGTPVELVVAQPPEPETPPPTGLTERERDILRESIVGIETLDDYTLMIELAKPDDRIPELIQRWADSEGFGFEWREMSEDGLRHSLGLRKGERTSYDFEKALRAALE